MVFNVSTNIIFTINVVSFWHLLLDFFLDTYYFLFFISIIYYSVTRRYLLANVL